MAVSAYVSFRFQTGSIKRTFLRYHLGVVGNSFDSKLVRLKVLLRQTPRPTTTKFRFQTGSIKSAEFLHRITIIREFRFQTGSIKSEPELNHKVRRQKFRFQTGSIKRTYYYNLYRMLPVFRFQTGSIKSCQAKLSAYHRRKCVSIPNWFD